MKWQQNRLQLYTNRRTPFFHQHSEDWGLLALCVLHYLQYTQLSSRWVRLTQIIKSNLNKRNYLAFRLLDQVQELLVCSFFTKLLSKSSSILKWHWIFQRVQTHRPSHQIYLPRFGLPLSSNVSFAGLSKSSDSSHSWQPDPDSVSFTLKWLSFSLLSFNGDWLPFSCRVSDFRHIFLEIFIWKPYSKK